MTARMTPSEAPAARIRCSGDRGQKTGASVRQLSASSTTVRLSLAEGAVAVIWRRRRATRCEAGSWRRGRELAAGTYVPDADRTIFKTLSTLLVDEYKANARRSTDRVEDAVAHLREFFTDFCPIRSITTDRILAYVRRRQEAEAANATINRELAALKRMFRLGEIAGRVARRPYVAMLEERNTRTRVLRARAVPVCPAQSARGPEGRLRGGIHHRLESQSEILTRQWHHVDFKAGWLRLEPGESKELRGPHVPADAGSTGDPGAPTPTHDGVEKASIIPWVFHRNRKAHQVVPPRVADGLQGRRVPRRIPHDFRRTAVRNLERAGVHALGRDEDGRPQDREHLPALRDRQRVRPARRCREDQALHDRQGNPSPSTIRARATSRSNPPKSRQTVTRYEFRYE